MLVSEAVVLVDGAVNRAAAEVNQDSGQELPIARHGLSPNAKAKQSSMQTIDVNNDGVIDEDEAQAAAISSVELRSSLSYARKVTFGALGLVLLSWLGNAGLTSAFVILAKDTYVKGDTTMSNAKGEVVGTRVATHNLPLIVAPVLPDDELFSVKTLRVTLPGSTTGLAEVSSGKAVNEVGPSEINSFRITRVQKVNSTAVVFHALGGEQIRVWNGVTTVRLSATGPEIPVCSSNVTCAAFQVEGAELAEKYLAQAEALLVPFEEGRRRLAEACRDPFTSDGREAAQTAAQDWCKPIITEAACRSFAIQIGVPFGRSSMNFITKGCYYYKKSNGQRQAYFGTGGSDAQMVQPVESSNRYRFSEFLGPDCLLLSNQAKLEETLESNQAAISMIDSKLDLIVSQLDSDQYDSDWYKYEGNSSSELSAFMTAIDCECASTWNGVALALPCESVSEWTACRNGQTYTGMLTVPAAVSSIGVNAFAYTDLTGLDLSEATALETIGRRAFFNNYKLTGTLKVSAAVTSIGDYAFAYTDLTGLDLSEATALKTIGRTAFKNNYKLTGTLKVSAAVTSIGRYAFFGTNLKELDLSEATALTTIGYLAFADTDLVGQTKCTPDNCFTLEGS